MKKKIICMACVPISCFINSQKNNEKVIGRYNGRACAGSAADAVDAVMAKGTVWLIHRKW